MASAILILLKLMWVLNRIMCTSSVPDFTELCQEMWKLLFNL